jgi:glycosyltransferase involved in cell wall biosynthesis
MPSAPALVIASKSRWDPPIRREHQLARLAAAHGHDVTFVEPPADVRALRSTGRLAWVKSAVRPAAQSGPGGIQVSARSTLMPAHRHRSLEKLEAWSLRRSLPVASTARPTVVATLPWQWPGVSQLRGYRRVLDVADDWASLLPQRSARVAELYAQAAEEADAITIVSDALRWRFPGRTVNLVRNALDPSLLATKSGEPPRARRLVYVGTLSERFDSALAGALIDTLPGWTLELYGGCAYSGRSDRPSSELEDLLARRDARVRWHGPVARARVAEVLDSADVLLLPNRDLGRGQDSMKIYDYSARGRPIVSTVASVDGISERPPHMRIGSTPLELAEQVRETTDEPQEWAADRMAWARNQTWESRWPVWAGVLFDAGPGATGVGPGNTSVQLNDQDRDTVSPIQVAREDGGAGT